MSNPSRQEIIEAIRIAGREGNDGAVRRLSAMLDAPQAQTTWAGEDAASARARNARPSGASLGSMVGAGFNAPPPRKSLPRQLGDSVVNNVAGAVQGLAMLPDAFIEAGAGGLRLLDTAVGVPSEALARAIGNERGAEAMRRDRMANDRALANPVTVGGVIEKIAPTPQDSAGQWARFGSQMIGAMAVPLGPKEAGAMRRVSPPPKAPRVSRNLPDAQDVVAAGKANNVRVMTSDVRPPRTALGKWVQARGEQIPIAGTGGPRAAQQAQRVDAVKGLVTQFGGQAERTLLDDATSAVDDVAANLSRTRGNMLGRLKGQKDAIITSLSRNDDIVPVDRTVSAIDEQIAALTRRGTPAAKQAAETLTQYRAAIQGKTLDQLEAIRADELGNAFKGGNTLADVKAVGEKAIRSIYDPLRAEMGTFIRQRGGEKALNQWAGANEQLASMAGELKSARFRNVLRTEELTPEAVGNLLFSKNRSDVSRLMGNLSKPGQAKARQAILQRAYDGAISTDGLSVERFITNINKLEPSVTGAFKGADLQHIRGLTRLLDATRRASAAGVMPPTGAQNTPVAMLAAAMHFLGTTATVTVGGGAGILARAYESAPVRNALIRAANVKAGTRSEAYLMDRAARALLISMQDDIAKVANDNLTRPMLTPLAADTEEQRQQGQ